MVAGGTGEQGALVLLGQSSRSRLRCLMSAGTVFLGPCLLQLHLDGWEPAEPLLWGPAWV